MKNVCFLVLLPLFTLFFFGKMTAQVDAATAEMNIRKAYAALERHDYNTFASLCTEDFAELGLPPQPVRGVWAAIEQYKPFFAAFPDLKFNIEQITPAGNGRYYLKVIITGTNSAAFMMLPPTGKSVRVTDIDIIELNAAGKCVSHWSANPDGVLDAIGYGSITNPSTGLVFAVYDAFGKGDVPGLLALCTDNVWFDIQDRSFDSKARIFKGKGEVGGFFGELATKFKYSKFQPVRFLADGDDVGVIVQVEFTHLPTGKNYTANYFHHFHISDGKIASFKGTDDFPVMVVR